MGYRPQKVWRCYKGHRILTWTEDDGVGAGLRRWFYKIDAGETVRAFADGHEGEFDARSRPSGRMRQIRFERKAVKCSVIPLEPADFDQWLEGTVDQARALMKLTPIEGFDAVPNDSAQKEIA